MKWCLQAITEVLCSSSSSGPQGKSSRWKSDATTIFGKERRYTKSAPPLGKRPFVHLWTLLQHKHIQIPVVISFSYETRRNCQPLCYLMFYNLKWDDNHIWLENCAKIKWVNVNSWQIEIFFKTIPGIWRAAIVVIAKWLWTSQKG